VIFLWLLVVASTAAAQTITEVRGCVRDSASGEPIVMASVFLHGANIGCSTDENGRFYLSTRAATTTVRFSAVGYATREIAVASGSKINLDVTLSETAYSLKEVVVRRGKEKYSKKDNPAVALAKKLIARRKQGDPRHKPYYTVGKYERVTYGLDNFDFDTTTNHVFDRYRFLQSYTDTVLTSGRPVLPVSIKETLATDFYSGRGENHKHVVNAFRSDGFDEQFDSESINRFIADAFCDIDLFGNDIPFMKKRFVSPLSSIGVSFYKYYLNDTVIIEGDSCVELSFVPFANQTDGFLGRLYVTTDTTLFIKKAVLNVPHAINLNFVDKVFIEQDYQRTADGTRLKTREDLTIEFMLIPNGQGLYAQRITHYPHHAFTPFNPTDISVGLGKISKSTSDSQVGLGKISSSTGENPTQSYEQWGAGGERMQRMMAQLRADKRFFWGEKFLLAGITGYFPTSFRRSKVDIGPVTQIFSFNPLEGFRIKLGGMTTAYLNPHWFARASVAYGFKDHKVKYAAEVAYSFKKKKLHSREFPIHGFTLATSYGVDRIGRNFAYVDPDNTLMSISRKSDHLLGYLRRTSFTYQIETQAGASFALTFAHNRRYGSRYLTYADGNGRIFDHFDHGGYEVTLRYAPDEAFFQGRDQRTTTSYDHPIITLRHTIMPKAWFNAPYTISRTELSFKQRFWFSAFGFADLLLKGAKTWSRVGFPDLVPINANLSYNIVPETFDLLDPMEFVTDQTLSWDLTYRANGALLNRLPLIKKLKLREVVSFRGVWGSLSDKNDPRVNADLFQFPEDAPCYDLSGKPYMEMSVGLDNILRLFRVDYVWRLSYRNTPNVSHRGVRFLIQINF